MSAQALSDRCGELGLLLPRPVLSNLENGRRDSISLGEILILAAALDVPPLQLVVPVGYCEDIEILPDLRVPVWDAAKWIDGESRPVIRMNDKGLRISFDGEPTIADYYRAHDAAIKSWRLLLERMTEAISRGETASAKTYEAAASRSVAEIASVRHRIHARGLLVPPAPSELTNLPTAEQSAGLPE